MPDQEEGKLEPKRALILIAAMLAAALALLAMLGALRLPGSTDAVTRVALIVAAAGMVGGILVPIVQLMRDAGRRSDRRDGRPSIVIVGATQDIEIRISAEESIVRIGSPESGGRAVLQVPSIDSSADADLPAPLGGGQDVDGGAEDHHASDDVERT